MALPIVFELYRILLMTQWRLLLHILTADCLEWKWLILKPNQEWLEGSQLVNADFQQHCGYLWQVLTVPGTDSRISFAIREIYCVRRLYFYGRYSVPDAISGALLVIFCSGISWHNEYAIILTKVIDSEW